VASDIPDSPVEPSRHFAFAVLGLSVIVGVFAVQSHWVPNKWLFGDGAFYANVARGLLEDHSLRQETLHPHSWYDRDLGWNHNVDAAWSNIALGRNGEWWPKHPFLMPLCAVPFLWAFGPIGTLLFHFLFYALIGVFAFRIASRVASRPAALASACAFATTPWIAERAWGFNNDCFYTVLILFAVDSALAGKAGLAGALLGIGVFAKSTNVLYGPGLVLLFALRKDFRGALRLCFFAAVPVALYLGLNAFLFGSPFRTGYDRILVREAGQLGVHSHAADFHFENLGPALKQVLLGSEGFLGRFPLIFPAAAGLVILLVRRFREGICLAFCLAVPIVFHAPYTWYRLEFNLPQAALAAAPLAALLPPFAGPAAAEETRPSRVRWGRLCAVLSILILVLSGLARRTFAARGGHFYEELPRAAVFLNDIPCDYYNNQMERWECSHYDAPSDWFMTGRALGNDLVYAGKPEKLLLLHPHPRNERRLEYGSVPLTDKLHLRYGLTDHSKNDALVHFKVLVGDKVVLEEDVRERKLVEKDLDSSAFAGTTGKVSFVVSSPAPEWCIFGVDGGPR
jgi:hypothetical protein